MLVADDGAAGAAPTAEFDGGAGVGRSGLVPQRTTPAEDVPAAAKMSATVDGTIEA
jgi:hypothetical protein